MPLRSVASRAGARRAPAGCGQTLLFGLACLLALGCRSAPREAREAQVSSASSVSSVHPADEAQEKLPAIAQSGAPSQAVTDDRRDASRAPLRAPVRIAALGDSLTDRRSFGGGYLDYVARRCPRSRIDNFGKGGDMVNQMRRRFEAQILSQPPGTYTHLIVFGGVNDLYSDQTAGRTVRKISADLDSIYETAGERGMKVVALTVAPWGGFRRYYNERRADATRELNEWIKTRGVEGHVDFVIDAYTLLSCGDRERLCDEYELGHKDGLHFNRAGHERLGGAIHQTAFADCL